MAGWWTSLVFLVGAYWPYVTAAAVIGVITGWLSLSPKTPENDT